MTSRPPPPRPSLPPCTRPSTPSTRRPFPRSPWSTAPVSAPASSLPWPATSAPPPSPRAPPRASPARRPSPSSRSAGRSSSRAMLKAVTFDFWETLVQDSAENLRRQRRLRIEALHRAVRRAGCELEESLVVEAYDRSERVLTESFWSQDRDPRIEEQVRLVLEIVSPSVCETMPSAHFEEALAGYIES